jgi:hypothetical protein
MSQIRGRQGLLVDLRLPDVTGPYRAGGRHFLPDAV